MFLLHEHRDLTVCVCVCVFAVPKFSKTDLDTENNTFFFFFFCNTTLLPNQWPRYFGAKTRPVRKGLED